MKGSEALLERVHDAHERALDLVAAARILRSECVERRLEQAEVRLRRSEVGRRVSGVDSDERPDAAHLRCEVAMNGATDDDAAVGPREQEVRERRERKQSDEGVLLEPAGPSS